MYRGRHRHEVTNETALTRIASTVFKEPVLGPREFFYADLFASRRTGCRSQLGLPGVRDQHAGCVGPVHGRARPVRLPAALAARQRHALAQARPRRAGHLARRGRPADRAADARGRRARTRSSRTTRSSSARTTRSRRSRTRSTCSAPSTASTCCRRAACARRRPATAEIAVCPSSRAAQVYVLDRDARGAAGPARRADAAGARRRRPRDAPHRPPRRRGCGALADTASCASRRAATSTDLRGETWSVDGDLAVLALEVARRPRRLGALSRRARARLVGAPLPHSGRGPRVRPARLGVPRLGSLAPHRRRLARLAARERLARVAALVRDRPRRHRRARAVDAPRRRPDGPRPLRPGGLRVREGRR